MFSFKKKHPVQPVAVNNEDLDENLKDRLFFHDVINHTHGLVLFLNQKEMDKTGISQEEVKMISREIKTLQSLVRDHYDFKHKNLVQTFDWVPFSYAKLAFDHLAQTYLGSKKIVVSFSIREESSAETLIYYPYFYRILNNLIKNISESSATQVDFVFIVKEIGLYIETKNSMKSTSEEGMPEYLSRVMLNENSTTIEGLGLESIHHLAEENGGTFSFEIADHVWINRIFLPSFKSKTENKAA